MGFQSIPSIEPFLSLDEVAKPPHVDFFIERVVCLARAHDSEGIQAQNLQGGALGRCHFGCVRVFDFEAKPFAVPKEE